MDESSISNNDGESLASPLQIKPSTSSLTSTSTSLTTASSLTTPRVDRTSGVSRDNELSEEWGRFYTRVERTPPKATRTAPFQTTVETANKLLGLSDLPDFQDKSFGDLTDDQQAMLLFMIMKEMHECFGGSSYSAKIIINALQPESKEYKRMMSYVRKGGDRKCIVASLMQNKLLEYVGKSKHTTIYQANANMAPFFHVQDEDSYICTYIACSELLYYSSHNNRKQNDDESIPTIKTNVCRYIRDEVSGQEIANFTLTDVKGAYLKRVLLGLMKSFGTGDCQEIVKIATWDGEQDNYNFLETFLRHGRPFVFRIECFPGLADKNRLEYKGQIANFYSQNERPNSPKERSYHALLCIGITPRYGENPPMLLVQDSCSRRPVFEIGLDLLMDIGLENLELSTVPLEWTFNQNMDYTVSKETKALFCGSPMSIDQDGVPRVIDDEEPAQGQRDMSRYLEVVTYQPGDILVYSS